MRDTKSEICREALDKPLEKMTEDPFFRADTFQNEPWYGDFEMYRRIGVCQPDPEHVPEIRKALKIMGYATQVTVRNGKPFLVPDEMRKKKERER